MLCNAGAVTAVRLTSRSKEIILLVAWDIAANIVAREGRAHGGAVSCQRSGVSATQELLGKWGSVAQMQK